jgi:hypothetical protein
MRELFEKGEGVSLDPSKNIQIPAKPQALRFLDSISYPHRIRMISEIAKR